MNINIITYVTYFNKENKTIKIHNIKRNFSLTFNYSNYHIFHYII